MECIITKEFFLLMLHLKSNVNAFFSTSTVARWKIKIELDYDSLTRKLTIGYNINFYSWLYVSSFKRFIKSKITFSLIIHGSSLICFLLEGITKRLLSHRKGGKSLINSEKKNVLHFFFIFKRNFHNSENGLSINSLRSYQKCIQNVANSAKHERNYHARQLEFR